MNKYFKAKKTRGDKSYCFSLGLVSLGKGILNDGYFIQFYMNNIINGIVFKSENRPLITSLFVLNIIAFFWSILMLVIFPIVVLFYFIKHYWNIFLIATGLIGWILYLSKLN